MRNLDEFLDATVEELLVWFLHFCRGENMDGAPIAETREMLKRRFNMTDETLDSRITSVSHTPGEFEPVPFNFQFTATGEEEQKP